MVKDNYLFEDGTLYEYEPSVTSNGIVTSRAGYFFCCNTTRKRRAQAIEAWKAHKRDALNAKYQFRAGSLYEYRPENLAINQTAGLHYCYTPGNEVTLEEAVKAWEAREEMEALSVAQDAHHAKIAD